MEKIHEFILAIDPSGAYLEGKGTTGWCVLDTKTNIIVETGTICAKDYNTYMDFWMAHCRKITNLLRKYKDTQIVLEDYFLYADRAQQQINSRFETIRLLGILEMLLSNANVPYKFQKAGDVMPRWENRILVYKGYIRNNGKRYTVATGKAVCDHQLDSIRHAVHYDMFYNKDYKKKGKTNGRNRKNT